MKKILTILVSFSLLASCTSPNKKQSDGWKELNRVMKTIDNITYLFPADVSLETRNQAIALSEQAIKENLHLIEEQSFTDTITFEFLHTRADMIRATGRTARGLAIPYQKAMYSLLDLTEKSPIKHELMHMICALNWEQNPYASMRWFNEGLATYSGKMCGKENFEELYYYYLTHDLLLPMDDMVRDFYGQNEVIGYSQSAYIVKYLSEEYGWEKLKQLWKGGFSRFSEVFGVDYTIVEKEMHDRLAKKFPDGVELDWDTLKNGCP